MSGSDPTFWGGEPSHPILPVPRFLSFYCPSRFARFQLRLRFWTSPTDNPTAKKSTNPNPIVGRIRSKFHPIGRVWPRSKITANITPPKRNAPVTLNSGHDTNGSGSRERMTAGILCNTLPDFQTMKTEVASPTIAPVIVVKRSSPSICSMENRAATRISASPIATRNVTTGNASSAKTAGTSRTNGLTLSVCSSVVGLD
jgi:hypothetical protein